MTPTSGAFPVAIGQSLDFVEDLAAAATSPDAIAEVCAADFLNKPINGVELAPRVRNARPYKSAFAVESCFAILREGAGSHFDPRVLGAFFAAQDEILAILTQLADVDNVE